MNESFRVIKLQKNKQCETGNKLIMSRDKSSGAT